MKYIKPPDFKSVREFEAHYKKIEQDITELLISDGSANTAKELNAKLSQALNAAVSYLTNVNKDFTNTELSTAFQEGRASVKEPPKVSAKEAAAILAKQGFKYAKNGFYRDTYIELQNATQTALNGMQTRVNAIIKDLHKTGQDSVYNVQQAIIKDLEAHNIFSVRYSNGAEQPLHSYAAMAARSARIESTNIGAIGRALQAGTDFVEMTTMPQCCKLCGAYQGKVYSISGKDKRFPALFKTVLRSGYALPHPNCRHEFIPWYEEIEAPEDVEKAIKNSKILYDKNGELVDVRFQKDIKGYAAWQAGNRQLNRELLEYERMKAYYASKGETPPYTTLGAFRRARRAQSKNYRESRIEWESEVKTKKIEQNKILTNVLGQEIVFSDRFNEEKWISSKKIIVDLAMEYDTRLTSVKVGQADKKLAGGSVNIGGGMYLASTKPETAIHEFAHSIAIENATKYGVVDNAEFWKEIAQIKRKYKKEVKDNAKKWISSYEHSSKGKDEFFAESFTLAILHEKGFLIPDHYGDALPYAMEVLRVTKKYFGKNKAKI